jgi:HlyD family secretion protein
MPKISWLATGAVALVAAIFGYRQLTAEEAATYRFATIEKGDLESAVSATGILNPVTSVQVGTQMSGKIVEIFADFNDQVKKGQLIARIDPTLQQQAIKDAEAGLERNRAEAARTRLEFERNKGLYEAKVLTEVEFNTAKYANEVAQANLKSAHVAVDRARQNLA